MTGRRLLPALHEVGLPFCLDFGHAHLNGVLEEFLAAGKPLHVHLHDNDGSGDAHQALGSGKIDYPRVLSLLPRNASRIVEVQALEAYDESVRFMAEAEKRSQERGEVLRQRSAASRADMPGTTI